MRTHRAPGAALILALAPICLAIWPDPALAQRKVPEGTKVLILTGGEREHHGYREQALYLAGVLEDTRRYQVTLAEDAAILETPALARYDLVLMNADRRDPEHKLTPGQANALFDFVRAGKGYVSIHGADNTPPDALPEWKPFLGGIYSHKGLPDGKAILGKYTVKIADKDSPVAKGLSDFELADELYSNMQMMPDVKPVATIDYKGTTWPVAWTWPYGQGRVFHTSLGHRRWGPNQPDPLADPNLIKLIVQGIDWAAGREPAGPAPK
ncbi:ThuA domain-containing protein [Tundrisphaera sp. TA3]|uniref:ThuA domain-containing protein n=1 Tax=Tundrisphaera sp. TA3 TaxID=3435775 RepID=UPI003EBFDE32